jgi:hypothetical protein
MYNNVHCHFGVSPILWPSHIRRVFSFFFRWRTMKSWCLLTETMSPSNSPSKVGYFWRWVSKVYIECRISAGLSNYAILLAFLNSAVLHDCSAIWSLKWGCACRWFGCHLLFLLEPSGDCTSTSCVCALANCHPANSVRWVKRVKHIMVASEPWILSVLSLEDCRRRQPRPAMFHRVLDGTMEGRFPSIFHKIDLWRQVSRF